ncbi:MAG TPA: beta-ketoacyl synthase N-terminal-like domain-containing protein, partial [Candidatus Deferrimicrobiaceae bacterium]
AARDALAEGGISVPVREERAAIVLGVDEGIDGIRARHSIALRDGGPLAVSPLSFPFTSHNAVTAQLSILLEIRGESLTLCGGALSGAAALGAARRLVLDGLAPFVLAGGVTSVEKEFLEGLSAAGFADVGGERDGAGILLLGSPPGGASWAGGPQPSLTGYGEAFGKDAAGDAVSACLDDAEVHPRDVSSVWTATPVPDGVEGNGGLPGSLPAARSSPHAGMYAAAFPLTVAAALRAPGRSGGRTSLIVGWDCLSGAAAALVRVS